MPRPRSRAASTRPSRPSIARRLATGLALLAMSGSLVVAAGAPAQAVSDTPIGNLDSATAVTGGIRVRGWAWDPNTSQSLTVSVKAGSVTRTTTANLYRPDVATVYPAAGTMRGYETTLSVPAGTYTVCATAINVGAGSNKAFPCRTVTVAGSTSTTTTTTTTSSTKLTWRPPALTSPTTINVSSSNRQLRLTAGRDYIIKMPSTPLDVPGGLIIDGGRNVVLTGGEIRISRSSSDPKNLRGLYLKSQSGTVHVEGLKITGSTLVDGIQMDQRLGATVQLQNVRIETVHGSYSGYHADVLQTWAGPAVLRIDRMTGYTTYQGFFLIPQDYGDQPQPRLFDFRNVNLVGTSSSKYLFWRDSLGWPVKNTNVWAKPYSSSAARSQFLRDGGATPYTWDSVKVGVPSSGDFVPSGRAGIGYVSPGYL